MSVKNWKDSPCGFSIKNEIDAVIIDLKGTI